MIQRSLSFRDLMCLICTMIYGCTSSTEYDILCFRSLFGVEGLTTANVRMQGLVQFRWGGRACMSRIRISILRSCAFSQFVHTGFNKTVSRAPNIFLLPNFDGTE